MTIADQLLSISNTKSAIKTAIEAKGVTVGSVPFTDYPSKIAAITGSGSTPEPIPDWVRPDDWLAMPDFSTGEQKIVGLFPVFNNGSNAVAFTLQGAYTVDWGDGIVESIASNVTASHNYSYASISDTTLSARGYKQVLITITPQAGQDLTSINFLSAATGGANKAQGIYVYQAFLDLILSIPNMTNQSNLSLSNSVTRWPYCERVWIKETSTSGINCPYLFASFYSLQSVPSFKLSVATNCMMMFNACYSLKKLEGFDFSPAGVGTGTLANMFQGCTNLEVISDTFAGGAITGNKMSNMFNGCQNIREIPSSLAGAAPTDLTYTFQNCYKITTIPALDYSGVTTLAQTFYNCFSLEAVSETSFPAVTSAGSAFYKCVRLDYFTGSFPVCNNMSSMFYGCDNLKEVNLSTSNLLTNTGSMFNSCFALVKVNAFNTTAVTTPGSMFANCYTLDEIPEFNFGSATTLSSIFGAGGNIRRIKATGFSRTFTVTGHLLSSSALNEIYTNLPTVSGLTIAVINNWGTAGDDPTIASSKGWTVTGS